MPGFSKFQLIDNQIIICQLVGAFNHKEAIKLYTEFRLHVNNFEQPFAIIMDITKFEGTSPEGYKEAEVFNQWLLKKNLVAKVNVIDAGIMHKLVEKNIPTREKLGINEFSKLEDSITFLKSKLK